jgi:hypothetical protein
VRRLTDTDNMETTFKIYIIENGKMIQPEFAKNLNYNSMEEAQNYINLHGNDDIDYIIFQTLKKQN